MDVPRISTIFNNCLLHSMTPELCSIIRELSEGRLQATVAHERLKQSFIEFYQINAPFSWQDFSTLLSNYNPFDIQILFGPVLREYMRKNLEQEPEGAGFLDGKTKAQFEKYFFSLNEEHGRYEILDAQAVSELFAKHLSFAFCIQQRIGYILSFEVPEASHIIRLQHTGTSEQSYHFEHLIDEENDIRIDYSRRDDSKLSFITKEIVDGKDCSLLILNLIRQHVHATLEGSESLERERLEIKRQLESFSELTRERIISSFRRDNAEFLDANSFNHAEIKSIREAMINKLYKILNEKISQRYSDAEAIDIKSIAVKFLIELQIELLAKPADTSIDNIRNLFIETLQSFNEETREYKNIFVILYEAIVYVLKAFLCFSDNHFSLKDNGFFSRGEEQDSPKSYALQVM